ncbi:hypothetical protein ACFQ6C_33200 [Streptomyces sp. NPDC056454]|uniref:hypothetical protein n=1 Tax=Streptomyces sp. NPDC056454 TaxID=3345823 RepID=UPI0036D00915
MHAPDPRYAGTLPDHGIRFIGHDDAPYIAELSGYWFLLYIVFQPELADDTSWPYPPVRAFASAEVGRTTET